MSGKRIGNPVTARIVAELRRQGWVVECTRKGHFRFIPRDRSMPVVVHGGTPGDVRATRNLFSQLKRSGADVSCLTR